MAAGPTDTVLGTRRPRLRLARDRRANLCAEGRRRPKGTAMVFICNHCPYVKAMIDRLVADARALIRRRGLRRDLFERRR